MEGQTNNKDLIQEIITIETIEETYVTETFVVTDSESDEILKKAKSQVCLNGKSNDDRLLDHPQDLSETVTNTLAIDELDQPVKNSTFECTKEEKVSVSDSDTTGIRLTDSASLTNVLASEKYTDSDILTVQGNPGAISVQNIIHTVVEAMDDFMNDDQIDFDEINEKIFSYQNKSGDKLAKRQKRMRSGIQCAFKQIEHIETIIKTLEHQCSANPLNHIKCLLLKIRGIVEEISLLSHRVGSTEKEVLIARDLWLLVRCLDELEVRNPTNKDYCDACVTAKEHRNADISEKDDIEDTSIEKGPKATERVPSFVCLCVASAEPKGNQEHDETPALLRVTTREKFANYCVQCFEYIENFMEHPKLVLFILFVILWLIKATGLLVLAFPMLCEDHSLYMPSGIEFNLRHYGLPPV